MVPVRLPLNPYFGQPVLHELRVVPKFGLELLKATTEDHNFVRRVFTIALREQTCFGVYLMRR